MNNDATMIIVDEDDLQAECIARISRDHGFDPQRVDSSAGFSKAYSPAASVIVVDLMLARVDGIEIIRQLSELECDAALIITGDADRRILNAAERLARARKLRVVGTLTKPINEIALRRLLDGTAVVPGDASRDLNLQVAQTELLQCMENGAVQVFYQPKINVKTLEFVAVEALVRLNHPQRGILRPDAFLAMAEESGLISRLTRTVFLQALQQTSQWHQDGLPLQLAINVSPLLLSDLQLPESLADLADRHGLDRDHITLEITETWVSGDPTSALDTLTRLRLKGFQLSIDDFGTGYSTMAQLNEFPYGEMKLDQQFIRDAARDREARTIVESSIELGHKLGMKVVAEGIERQEDWDLISDLTCDEGQGFFIARPMHSDKVPTWLEHWNACLGRL